MIKKNKNYPISFRLKRNLAKKLKKTAKKLNISQSQLIMLAINNFLHLKDLED